MNSYETSATVGEQGRILVTSVPFEPGTEVEISISPKRRSADEFTAAWRRVCTDLRGRTELQNMSDQDIQAEIDGHRAQP